MNATSAKATLAMVALTATLAEATRASGKIPSGHLYSLVCDKVSIGAYELAIATLKRAGLVSESAHELTWIGPRIEENVS